MMNAPQAVLFDFDGTLIDSYPAITASVNHIRARHGLPPMSEAEVRRHVGRGAVVLMRETVPDTNVEEDLALYHQHHPTVMRSGTRLLPGAIEALTPLKQGGLHLGMCSNKPRDFTVELLQFLGLAPLLEVVLGPEDVAEPKPGPDMLLAALQRLKLRPEQALYVGDMTIDIQTARAAGVPVWVVPTGSDERSTLQAARPDRLIDGLMDLPRLLLR